MVSEQPFRKVFWWAALASTAGCGERDRLTFPSENPGAELGPITAITQPFLPDTTLVQGDVLQVQGLTHDADGVDTVYFELEGVNFGFAPIIGQGADTVEFGLQLSTFNFVGDTVVLRVYGVDLLGDRGLSVSRQIRVE